MTLDRVEVGETVRGHDGRYTTVEAVEESDARVVVYNLEVSECHTFFVAGAGWGFSVWVHNEELCNLVAVLRDTASSA